MLFRSNMKKADVVKLVVMVRQGSARAQEVLMQRFRPLIFALYEQKRYESIQDELPGICQVAIWDAIRHYQGKITKEFPGYIKGYLENVLNNAARKKRRYFYREGTNISELHFPEVENFDGNLITKTDLLNALKRLTIRERYLIWARYFRHYQLAHMSMMLKINRFELSREINGVLNKLRRWCS